MSELDVCSLDELAVTGAKGFELETEHGAVPGFVVDVDGSVHAYLNSCPHTGACLDWAPDRFLSKDRSLIMCCVHGAIFGKGDGVCVEGPCVGASLTRLQARVEGDRVLVTAGDAPLW